MVRNIKPAGSRTSSCMRIPWARRRAMRGAAAELRAHDD
jgi:hypothetical protein